MKVLYDISVLGQGYCNPVCRAGIFRVVEIIAQGLVAHKDCDPTFCASGSFKLLDETLRYLKADSQFSKVNFAYARRDRLLNLRFNELIHQTLTDLNQQIPNTKGLRQALLKLVRRPVFQAYLNTLDLHPLNSESVNQADLFHSTFYPLTAKTKQQKRLENFLTFYDLIPILHPQFFPTSQNDVSQVILQSLEVNNWAICISHATKADLCNLRTDIDPDRVFVTHLAASALFYPCSEPEQIVAVKRKYNLPDAPYFLSLSTLEPRKNIDHTIRCFAKLVQQEKLQDLHLVLVGNKGWDYNKIFEAIDNLDFLRERIVLTGFVADEDLAALYSSALAFIYPSFYEGFGLPPLEAMQCGIPVITSNTSSLLEVVGDAGIMLDPYDEEGLCQSMLNVLNQSCLRQDMALKSLQQAKQFSWQKCIQETIAAYKVALAVR